MRQVTASLNKELLFFGRGFRFGGMVITFAGCALLYPLMCLMMIAMEGMMAELAITGLSGVVTTVASVVASVSSSGFGISSEEAALFGGMEEMFKMFSGESGMYMSYISTLGMFVSTAGIVVMVLIMGAAGGEQKKRSIIIPQTAGLTATGYVLPKFMLYPPLVFVLTLLSTLLTNAISQPIFGTSYSFETALATGALYGVFMMFSVCLYIFLGISLTQPGLSVIYVLAGNTIFSLIITMVFQVDRFTPWNLTAIADSLIPLSEDGGGLSAVYAAAATEMVPYSDIATTVVITLVLCVGLMLGTLFAVTAKKMDNTADEVY